ncbi:MAG: hypothetical protein MJ175_01505 [Clostridia bacterium]|nr:hypothetical protein [Clostridia bacterium]
MMKKIPMLLIAVVLLILVVICTIPISWNISKNIKVNYLADFKDETAAETELVIEGRYTFRLFRPDRFEGELELKALPKTAGKYVELELSHDQLNNLIYHNWNSSKLVSSFVGYINADTGMKQVMIAVTNPEDENGLENDHIMVFYTDGRTMDDVKAFLSSINPDLIK